MTFRGMDLDFDIYDADTAERYEAAVEAVSAASAVVEGETLSTSIRRQCSVVFDFFDGLFGDGFHKELFGARTNLMECLDVFAEFMAAVDAQRQALTARVNKYTPNRAARRANSRP